MRKFLIIVPFSVFLFSCNQKKEDIHNKTPVPVLITIGYFHSFYQPLETIINLKDQYILFYSPHDYSPIPPPPQNSGDKKTTELEKQKYQSYLAENPKPVPFQSPISIANIQDIENILSKFQKEDYENKEDLGGIDGMTVNIVITYSDGKIIQINPIIQPSPVQRELYVNILELVISKNKYENNTVLVNRLIRRSR